MYEPDKAALDWIENRAPCSEFRLKDADFTVGNQNKIRELYRTRMLMMKANEFDRLRQKDFDVGKINTSINELKKSTNFDYLYNARYGKLGPGEVMLYLLIDKASLGSGKTGDVVLGNKKIEVKSFTEMMVRKGLAHVIASDCHRPFGRRAPNLYVGYQAAARLVGESKAKMLVCDNPKSIINGNYSGN